MRRRRSKERLEMKNVSFDAFAIFALKDGIVVIEFHDCVGPFKFRSQFSVFVEKVMDSH